MKNERVYQYFEIARELGGTGRVQWRERERGELTGPVRAHQPPGSFRFYQAQTHTTARI